MAVREEPHHMPDANLYLPQLVRTGKFFQNASSHDPKHLVYTKESITQDVTAANRRFHEALDEVEIEIVSVLGWEIGRLLGKS